MEESISLSDLIGMCAIQSISTIHTDGLLNRVDFLRMNATVPHIFNMKQNMRKSKYRFTRVTTHGHACQIMKV